MSNLHFIDINWRRVMGLIRQEIAARGLHPSACVVLVPYAQLMPQARLAWAAQGEAAFVPRFETTMNWANNLQMPLAGPLAPAPGELTMDTACDWLTAAGLLAQAGLGAHKEILAGRLIEAAWSLARLAAAWPPEERAAWGQKLAPQLAAGMDSPLLKLESAVGQIALAWASTSAYPTDVLFLAEAELLVVLDGFQADPLSDALKSRWGERALSLPLLVPGTPGQTALQAASDAEDEAQRATACVLARLSQGLSPVALVAQDRLLTRRVRAMLANLGVAVRDETGWKLSTTRAAASIMSLLRAAAWDVSSDAMLDWLKNAPVFDAAAVTSAEKELRKDGLRQWRQVGSSQPAAQALADAMTALLSPLQGSRALTHGFRLCAACWTAQVSGLACWATPPGRPVSMLCTCGRVRKASLKLLLVDLGLV